MRAAPDPCARWRDAAAEMALVGHVLRAPDDADVCLGLASAADFDGLAPSLAWGAIGAVRAKRGLASELAVTSVLRHLGHLETVGAPGAFAEWRLYGAGVRDPEQAARIVARNAMARRVLGAAQTILAEPAPDPEGLAARAMALLGEASLLHGADEGVAMADAVAEFYDDLARRCERGERRGVLSGIAALDELLQGMEEGGLNIIAARPAGGKTSLALDIAANVAAAYPGEVLFWSLEMKRIQLTTRAMARAAAVNARAYRTAKVTPDEWARTVAAANRLGAARMRIYDGPGWSARRVRTELIRATARAPKDAKPTLGVIDYLQYMDHAPRPRENLTDAIERTTRELVDASKTTGVPLVVLCQLNRGNEKAEREPRPSDLKSSGAIEQDAGTITLLHKEQPGDQRVKVIVGKNRFDAPGEFWLGFDGATTSFGADKKPPAGAAAGPPPANDDWHDGGDGDDGNF